MSYMSVEKNINIRKMQDDDLPQVKDIYWAGIKTKNATFEISVPDTLQDWNARYISRCRFVAVNNQGMTVGWVMLSSVSNRSCYSGIAEISVYVEHKFQSMGIGSSLLSTVITDSENNGFWTLQAGVLPENKASIIIHEKCGFRQVGVREKIAMLDGQWRNMILLERRSKKFI